MSNVKTLIQGAFDAAEATYETGHLTGDQIKTFLASAMALVDTDAAMLMNGKQVSAGTFKLQAFPLDKLQRITEPDFMHVTVNAPVAVTEDEGDATPFDIEGFVSMSPKKALETLSIPVIEKMIDKLKVEVKEGLNDVQKTAALQAALKKK